MTQLLNTILIQASSTSWQGDSDSCMTEINNKLVIEHTILNIRNIFPDSKIIIIAPEFDKNGALVEVSKNLNTDIFFGYDDSPASRIYKSTEHLENDDFFLRIDGLNYQTRELDLLNAINIFNDDNLDFLKFEDDFPPQITFEIYKKECFDFIYSELPKLDPAYHVHIKHLPRKYNNLKTHFYIPNNISNDELLNIRISNSQIYSLPRGLSNNKAIQIGNQLSFHYDLVKKYLNNSYITLDLACGDGTGANTISPLVQKVFAVDIDENQIKLNLKNNIKSNVFYSVENGEKLSFEKDSFDIITSMETIEHCQNPKVFLSELKRVLKKDGLLFISTPQNCIGHIPLNVAHNIEYSKDQFIDLLNNYFTIVEFYSIKSGRIIGSPGEKGQNSFAIVKN